MTVLKKKLLLGLILLGLVSSCFAKSKTLVVYFSCTGTTEKLAKVAANHLGADIFKIEAKIPYTAADLKYYTDCRADKEQNDKSARPEIANKVSNMADYDTVVLAYPIWHGQAPRIISTFLESYDFSGKTIIPFCTSASSGIGNSDTELHKLCSQKAKWIKGMRFGKDTKESELKAFLDRNIAKENLL